MAAKCENCDYYDPKTKSGIKGYWQPPRLLCRPRFHSTKGRVQILQIILSNKKDPAGSFLLCGYSAVNCEKYRYQI